jgi:hypothetical protein
VDFAVLSAAELVSGHCLAHPGITACEVNSKGILADERVPATHLTSLERSLAALEASKRCHGSPFDLDTMAGELTGGDAFYGGSNVSWNREAKTKNDGGF